jgi:hypothetical protein
MTDKTLKYIGKVVSYGNSLHVAIPKPIREFANLNKGDILKIELCRMENHKNPMQLIQHNGRIVQPSYMISENLSQMMCEV